MSLCRSIYGIVDKARDERVVTAVHLQVGQLRQVVPDTLTYCWSMITETTPLAGSILDIDHVPVRLDCAACGERTTVEHVLVLTCASCSQRRHLPAHRRGIHGHQHRPRPDKGELMGRFHRHDDGTEHQHDHEHEHPDGGHGDHSAYETGPERVSVLERIFGENDVAAEANRAAFDAHGIRSVNLMSSPGAGKTTLWFAPWPTCATSAFVPASSKVTSRPRSMPIAWPGLVHRSPC